jgi:hypothetical protein
MLETIDIMNIFMKHSIVVLNIYWKRSFVESRLPWSVRKLYNIMFKRVICIIFTWPLSTPFTFSVTEIGGFIHINPNSRIVALFIKVFQHRRPIVCDVRMEKIGKVGVSCPNITLKAKASFCRS